MENGNNGNNLSFDNMWTINHSRFDWGNSSTSSLYDAAAATTTTTADTNSATNAHSEASAAHHALMMFPHSLNHHHLHHHQQSLYGGDGSNLHPDPHLMCLKLGKRHYFEDCSAPISDRHAGSFSLVKRGKPYYSCGGASTDGGGVGVGVAPSPSSSSSSPSALGTPASVPRCQVEGCHVALINAKDYHRRHKVCEMHSKAPKVVVLGLEQRFCQQCSRFHVVSEFDDSKRSCRRRLAGHNERRRKSSHDSVSRNSSQGN
ncbi:hypothetical protein EZV62_009589 [Acer yangbiense]|uniref:SBP-type domain-containing protein n=1 Tax=Acer yangbiense TaxID=1000413 RepID=A0A5C7I0L1_9ROSI|nr:hypothetical protein EZV62_009589 [Acer yangbiense]